MSITRVNTNFDAIFATNQLKSTELQLQKSMARLSSGKRINYASDDPMGVGQLTTAKASLSGTRQAQMNIQQDLAMLQFVDGVMQNFEDKVIQLKDLCIQAANDATLSTTQVTAMETQLTTALTDLADTRMDEVRWNGKQVFSAGGFTDPITFHVGGEGADTFNISVSSCVLNSAQQGAAGTDFSGVSVADATTAASSVGTLSDALNSIAGARSVIGATMQRLEFALEGQMNMETNYAAAVSTIGDADIAVEISKLTTSQIISQSAAAMLGQANIHSQTLLNILM